VGGPHPDPGIGVRELTQFQVNDNQASKTPMEEEEIYPIPGVADTQTALPANKGEVAAELKKRCPSSRVSQHYVQRVANCSFRAVEVLCDFEQRCWLASAAS